MSDEKSAKNPSYPVGTIAKLLLMTERRVQQLASEGVIPKSDRGRYDLVGAVQGYVRYLQDRSITPGNAGTVDYHAEKARLTKAQADTAEIELAKLRGDLASIDDFERAQAVSAATIRTNIMSVPQRVVIRLLGETNEARFKETLKQELALALETAANAELGTMDDFSEDEE